MDWDTFLHEMCSRSEICTISEETYRPQTVVGFKKSNKEESIN